MAGALDGLGVVDWRVAGERCRVEDGIIVCPVHPSPAIDLYEAMGGARLRELQLERFTQAYWEAPIYREAVRSLVVEAGVEPGESVAVDLGSGDGRFTELLLDMGFRHVVAVDAILASLRRLQRMAVERGYVDRVTIIRSDIAEAPLAPGSADLVLAIESLYYLNERYEQGLARAVEALKPGGALVESEPDREGMAVKSLAYEDPANYLAAVLEGVFVERYSEGLESRFRVFTLEELRSIHRRHGLVPVSSRCIPLAPMLLRIAEKRGLIDRGRLERMEPLIRRSLEELARGCSCRRVNILLSKKPGRGEG